MELLIHALILKIKDSQLVDVSVYDNLRVPIVVDCQIHKTKSMRSDFITLKWFNWYKYDTQLRLE